MLLLVLEEWVAKFFMILLSVDFLGYSPCFKCSPHSSPTLHYLVSKYNSNSSLLVKLHWITPQKGLQHFIDTRFHSFMSNIELFIYPLLPEMSSRLFSVPSMVRPQYDDPSKFMLIINCWKLIWKQVCCSKITSNLKRNLFSLNFLRIRFRNKGNSW